MKTFLLAKRSQAACLAQTGGFGARRSCLRGADWGLGSEMNNGTQISFPILSFWAKRRIHMQTKYDFDCYKQSHTNHLVNLSQLSFSGNFYVAFSFNCNGDSCVNGFFASLRMTKSVDLLDSVVPSIRTSVRKLRTTGRLPPWKPLPARMHSTFHWQVCRQASPTMAYTPIHFAKPLASSLPELSSKPFHKSQNFYFTKWCIIHSFM